ncbi:MAG: IS21 family transposase [Armatimonadetes bacterium]|nr:IS21 family transposase [Armatimonadota bacterium]
MSKRQILRETGMHWKTLKKILTHSQPPGYQRQQVPRRPKLDPYLGRIRAILDQDKQIPKKQRHTAKRIFERLRDEGYTGGYTVVKEVINEIRRTSGEVFMPLVHRPGDAQVDYFFALARLGGTLQKVAIFLMALPYSDAFFMMCVPRECTESFWEGHVRAFAFFGGVPTRISYDNSKIAAEKIIGAHSRKLTDGFLQLASHYLFDYHFCTVRRPNEKGLVEGTGGYARRNFLVPVPDMADYDALNAYLLGCCQNDLQRQLRGQAGRKADLLKQDQSAFIALPAAPFDACRKQAARSNSLSLVRFHDNDYSVPVCWAHHEMTVKGYWDRVEICRGAESVASHQRNWGRGQVTYEPRHYLPLLDRKPGALDHGRPLQGLQLPDCFALLRRRLESDNGHKGTKDYITVLQMIEKHSVGRVAAAIDKALVTGAPSSDVVAIYLYPDLRTEPGTFVLDGRPQLRAVVIAPPQTAVYRDLLEVVT